MSASAYPWGEDNRQATERGDPAPRRPGNLLRGPWPAVEEIRGEFEHAVVIDRAQLMAHRPAVAGPPVRVTGQSRAGAGASARVEWLWTVAVLAVMALLAAGLSVASWQLVQVAQGHVLR